MKSESPVIFNALTSIASYLGDLLSHKKSDEIETDSLLSILKTYQVLLRLASDEGRGLYTITYEICIDSNWFL